VATEKEAKDWRDIILDTGKLAANHEEESRKKERAMRIARELSNLVIYCQSVVFNADR
jgi:phosphatidylinositol phospholipase C gamma-1